jgi:predicted DNA-binding protein
MHMAVRTQIYLTEGQRAGLRERGRRQGKTMAQLIREAIDQALADEDAVDATFGSAPEIGRLVPPRSEWQHR